MDRIKFLFTNSCHFMGMQSMGIGILSVSNQWNQLFNYHGGRKCSENWPTQLTSNCFTYVFMQVSDDILTFIFSFCANNSWDLLRISHVCASWNKVLKTNSAENSVWRVACELQFLTDVETSWRELCITKIRANCRNHFFKKFSAQTLHHKFDFCCLKTLTIGNVYVGKTSLIDCFVVCFSGCSELFTQMHNRMGKSGKSSDLEELELIS